MSLDTAEKQKLIETHQVHSTDTGSAEVQVAMLSKRIAKLSDHLQGNIHDFASRQGLLKMIGKRKRLLSFIKDKNVQKYQELVKKIGIRGRFQIMKKNQSKKKTQFKKNKNYWVGQVIDCIGGARNPNSWTLFQVANIDNGEITIINADIVEKILKPSES